MMMGLVATICAGYSQAQENSQLQLALAGQTNYVISLAEDAIPAEKTAALQLQSYLHEVTGATFPLKEESEVDNATPQILVGAGKKAKELLPQQNWSAAPSDSIIIKSVGQHLVLAGDRPRGTLYAVFQFLEDAVGCRWWTPSEKMVPSKSTLTIPAENIFYTPPFRYREHYTTAVMKDAKFATIMRENGHYQPQQEEWGGHYQILGFVHTMKSLLPLETYFKTHPEWYSDPQNGFLPATSASPMPGPNHTDACYSNPEVVNEVAKNALEWIKKNPEAGYISISQNDNTASYCRDEASVELIKREASPAAPLIQFVNAVAERIHQYYPDFIVETLAYQYSEIPPKTIRPARNVMIRLAPISSDFGRPLNSDANHITREKLQQWSQISNQLFIWNYVTNFQANMLPHPNWDGLAQDLRFFAEHNVKGVFQQGDAFTNGVGDFVQLRAWLMGKLLWNPYLDQEKLTDEFLAGYYGDSAPYLQRYIDLVKDAFLAQNRKLGTFNNDFSFFDLDVMNQSMELFDQAEKAAQNQPEIAKRIRRDRLSLEWVRLYRFYPLERTARREGKVLLGDADPARAMRKFVEDAKNFGIIKFDEGTYFENKVPTLLQKFTDPVALPASVAQYPAEDVIDIQDGGYTLYRQGSLTDIIDDPVASNSKAVRILNQTHEWAAKVELDQYLDTSNDRWHVYAVVRVDGQQNAQAQKMGMACGFYDHVRRKVIVNKEIPLEQVLNSEYQTIDLGIHALDAGSLLWFSPVHNPAVKSVLIDRVILVRQK